MKSNNDNSIGRFRIILGIVVILAVYILGTALHTMLPPQSNYWEKVDKRFTTENISIPANRGNILSADGQVLSGSIPVYRLYMDFKVYDPDSISQKKIEHWRDSAFEKDLDSIAIGLANIFQIHDAAWFKNHLRKGKERGKFAWNICPGKLASYIQYKECKKLPMLRERTNKSGFHAEEIMQRKKPYGMLASRTLGDLYADSNAKPKCGLELSFDSILRGKPGTSHTTKVLNKRIRFVDMPPENGNDLLTTLDINIQDVADRALRNKLKEVNGEIGMAVVMEVKTGDVKAIVNLTRMSDGEYYECKNNAVSDLMEPGSTFKTASIMVALDDGKIDKNTRIDTGSGIYLMHGRHMKDHNWHKGGYGELTVPQVLMFSSNIGVSRLIDEAYKDDPDRYVRGLNKLGVGLPLNLPFVGKGEPRVRHPKKQGKFWLNWSNTALPWMSIGYETMLPPIATLAFYNGIANGGKFIKPRFVTAELKDGQVIREFPTEVIKESMCKPSTLADIHEILEKVVSEGLGKKAGNNGKYFKVSGKTGTAQIASAKGGGYHSGTTRYMVSFCGFFPSEAPKYSCIVCIVKTGLPASGGGQCGPVFSEISQYIMAKGNCHDAKEVSDSNSVFIPSAVRGQEELTNSVMHELGINTKLETKADTIPANKVPNVVGMGARDAVYELQKRGLKVRLLGKGRVKSQDIPEGRAVEKGKTITIRLG